MELDTVLLTTGLSVGFQLGILGLWFKLRKETIIADLFARVDNYVVAFAENLKKNPQLLAEILRPAVKIMLNEATKGNGVGQGLMPKLTVKNIAGMAFARIMDRVLPAMAEKGANVAAEQAEKLVIG